MPSRTGSAQGPIVRRRTDEHRQVPSFWVIFGPPSGTPLLPRAGNLFKVGLNGIQSERLSGFLLSLTHLREKDSAGLQPQLLPETTVTVRGSLVPSSSETLSLLYLFAPLPGDIPGLSLPSLAAWLCDLGQVTAVARPPSDLLQGGRPGMFRSLRRRQRERSDQEPPSLLTSVNTRRRPLPFSIPVTVASHCSKGGPSSPLGSIGSGS